MYQLTYIVQTQTPILQLEIVVDEPCVYHFLELFNVELIVFNKLLINIMFESNQKVLFLTAYVGFIWFRDFNNATASFAVYITKDETLRMSE